MIQSHVFPHSDPLDFLDEALDDQNEAFLPDAPANPPINPIDADVNPVQNFGVAVAAPGYEIPWQLLHENDKFKDCPKRAWCADGSVVKGIVQDSDLQSIQQPLIMLTFYFEGNEVIFWHHHEIIIIPATLDLLAGRGKGLHDYSGNERVREIIHGPEARPHLHSRGGRNKLRLQILRTLASENNRYLKLIDRSDLLVPPQVGWRWKEVVEGRVVEVALSNPPRRQVSAWNPVSTEVANRLLREKLKYANKRYNGA